MFLGAGASKPFGIPTMAEFTDVIIKDLASNGKPGFEPLVKGIQTQIETFGLNPDIEAILSVLQAKANPRKALEDVGAQIIVFSDKFRDIAEDVLANVAVNQIEEAIYRRCAQVDHKKAVELYSQLWNNLTTNVRFRNLSYGTTTNNILVQRIFTTNYDLGVEAFLKRKRLRFADGFEVDEVGDAVFTGRWTNADIAVCKLHGSINYFGRDDGQIVRSDVILENADAYGREVRGRIMIYPTGEKYATRFPFYEALGQLRFALTHQERACIVIGYSFRDAAINNAFVDGITLNPKLRVVWVTPHSHSSFKNLDPLLQSRVITLNGEFGNQQLPQSIMEAIQANVEG